MQAGADSAPRCWDRTSELTEDAEISGARWKWELAAKPRLKFRQIWVFTAKFLKIEVFKQKSGKSVYKMQFLQRIIALCFDLNNLNGIKIG